jgi:hypothetical protein
MLPGHGKGLQNHHLLLLWLLQRQGLGVANVCQILASH